MVIDQMFKQDPHGKPALLCQTAIEGAGDFAALDEAEDLRIFLITYDHRLCIRTGLASVIAHSPADICDTAAGDEQGVDFGIGFQHLHCLAVGILGAHAARERACCGRR